MNQKKVLSFLIMLLSLATSPLHCSLFDKIDEVVETASKIANYFMKKEAAREKKRKHNQAVRILTKMSRKHAPDFECLNKTTDNAKTNCLAFNTGKKDVPTSYATYFEQIKEHYEKTENAEFDLDENEKINPSLNAQKINEKMNLLQTEYKRLFRDKIRATRGNIEERKS